MATWKEITEQNPAHSENYAQRWRNLEAAGNDIYGEARTIDALAPRGAKILDAGCGQGRIGGYLSKQGHKILGTDLDPVLIKYASEEFPDARWIVGDLSEDPIPESDFDLIVSAGNVMGFLAENGRRPALENLHRVLSPQGRAVIGFGAGRGWAFGEFIEMAESVGFELENAYESWELKPFTPHSDFLVAIFTRKAA
ncbi:SAM-dependent methyltransferase [Corynebacterium deserti GIMN1.010]|uniref:SAM-dependent methyltransferase n=1 Tax=Corynebacterium deserti GIMN1.010 TaxID=931089 RepID=A0A0M4CIC6_9CORY|nr:class I SAM-dependent methyltransferase [Corynebacterium deserti]ALC05821.1 SAM-dependent methyltransferase [Corynebacterium deserti GIMN1.010]